MAATKELIKRIRLTASAASITFYNIPQDFDGLELQFSLRSTRSAEIVGTLLRFNESTSNFTARELLVTTGGGAGSSSYTTGRAGLTDANTATANTFGSMSLFIPNYASSNYKSFSIDSVAESNSTMSYNMNIVAGLWSNTAAITSITLVPDDATNWMQYSSAALYGWKKGSDGTTTVS